ncbi:MAG: hypothetical protein IT350_11570 [Deltaproteobacteria bacterium]|nr:hypothetical protein [Deltaproteobacteria bacterium]
MLAERVISFDFLEHILDSVSANLIVTDAEGVVRYANASAEREFRIPGESDEAIRRTGPWMGCEHERDHPQGCGFGEFCRTECALRAAVRRAVGGTSTKRQSADLSVVRNGEKVRKNVLISAVPIEYAGETLALITLEDVTELVKLRGIIPICASCKKVRNDEDYWENVEAYVAAHSDASFSHGFCPECVEHLYGARLRELAASKTAAKLNG